MGFIKSGLTRALSRRVLIGADKRLIFLYHDISDLEKRQHSTLYSTTVKTFQEQIEFLALNFTLVSLDDILSPDLAAKRCAAIVFDDGFLSVQQTAMPYLNSKGIPFAIFLNRMAMTENSLRNSLEDDASEQFQGERVFLNETEVRSLSDAGVRIGSHTASHRQLVNCDEPALREEIDGNKDYLERVTGQEVRYLALPFGKREHYNQTVLDHCRQAGHDFIFTTNPTSFDLSSPSYQRRLIPRIGLTDQSPGEIMFLINRPLLKTIDI